ncbi:hypothetical protein [Embleya sp. NPDC005575]|uniref:hypothetical protein n=1 Tax=Embleya sp. NPDC005575 TaxID=3156892 RepID=UPI0033BF94AC
MRKTLTSAAALVAGLLLVFGNTTTAQADTTDWQNLSDLYNPLASDFWKGGTGDVAGWNVQGCARVANYSEPWGSAHGWFFSIRESGTTNRQWASGDIRGTGEYCQTIGSGVYNNYVRVTAHGYTHLTGVQGRATSW